MRDDAQRQADRFAEDRLELMPRSVRDKLDRVGVKLHLKEWQALSVVERVRLRDLPCGTPNDIAQYASVVEQLVVQLTGAPPQRLKEQH